MKRIFITLIGTVLTCPAKLPDGINDLVAQTSTTLGKTLAEHYPEDQKNFSTLAQNLRKMGFGKAPLSPPPWYEEKVEGESEQMQNDREAEMRTRLKSIGESDLTFLKSLDTNENLTITKEEISLALKSQLEVVLKDRLSVDKNDDGKLSLKEYALIVPARGEISPEDGVDWHQRGHFQSDDENKDSFIDQSEMLGHEIKGFFKSALKIQAVHFLSSADKDQNGTLTKIEFPALWVDSLPLAQAYPAIYWFSPEKLKSLQ